MSKQSKEMKKDGQYMSGMELSNYIQKMMGKDGIKNLSNIMKQFRKFKTTKYVGDGRGRKYYFLTSDVMFAVDQAVSHPGNPDNLLKCGGK